jgi:hypothetical protein
MYVTEEEKIIEDIAADLFVDRKTVYEDLKRAKENLCALIFGIDGLNK